VLTYPRGVATLDLIEMDARATGFPLGDIRYACSAGDACTGFTVNSFRVRNLQFRRVTLATSERRQ
jgi:hypothetical protein